jgi:2',3'-cyclic-nucleotide 2'-phosphodiesterase/3'-nucleotidase
LATTDVHGHLGLGHEPFGLAQAAHLMSQLKQDCENCIVLDNGDFLQGAPICDLVADGALGLSAPHPVIEAMNCIGYDAVGLGNHEFDYGLPFLSQALSRAEFPIVCSNVKTAFAPWQEEVLLERTFVDTKGQPHNLTIGLFSLVPPQVREWYRVHFESKAVVSEFSSAAQERIASLKTRGADLVIALCHAGDVPYGKGGDKEPLASEITSIPGLDVVICGHTHRLSPGIGETRYTSRSRYGSGSAEVPLVLPGHNGQFVGCIELTLCQDSEGWRWTKAKRCNVEVTSEADPEIDHIARPHVNRAAQSLASVVGHTDLAISTYFAVAECDPTTRIAAAAQAVAAKPLLEERGYKDMPTVVAAGPFRAGYDGPTCYAAVPKGPVTLADVYDIYPYFNALDAFEITGAQARDWLETSASALLQVAPGQQDQPLWNPGFPTYEFDSLLGLTYRIDLSRPPLYAKDRSQIENVPAGRIVDLCLNGAPLTDDARLVLVTNAYRGGGGGRFPHMVQSNRIALPFRDIRTSIQDLFAGGLTEADLPAPSWSFAPLPNTSVTFETGFGADEFVPMSLTNRLESLGATEEGFQRFRLSLDH